MSFKGLRMLKIPKLPDFEKYWKSSKNIQRGDPWKKNFFSFLFNTLFYTRQSYKTIRMSFGGLRMLKSPKLTQCYSFASVSTIKLKSPIPNTQRWNNNTMEQKIPWSVERFMKMEKICDNWIGCGKRRT